VVSSDHLLDELWADEPLNVRRTSATYAWTITKDGEPHVKGVRPSYTSTPTGPEPLAERVRAALDR
jgi:hypothetical protein